MMTVISKKVTEVSIIILNVYFTSCVDFSYRRPLETRSKD